MTCEPDEAACAQADVAATGKLSKVKKQSWRKRCAKRLIKHQERENEALTAENKAYQNLMNDHNRDANGKVLSTPNTENIKEADNVCENARL